MKNVSNERANARLVNRRLHCERIRVGQGDRFFDQNVFARFRRQKNLLAVQMVWRADHRDIHARVPKRLRNVRIDRAVGKLEIRRFLPRRLSAAGADGYDPRIRILFKRPNMRAGYPTRSNDQHPVRFHMQNPFPLHSNDLRTCKEPCR
mgnify:CR=1 FL=1